MNDISTKPEEVNSTLIYILAIILFFITLFLLIFSMPNVSRRRPSARVRACMSNVREIMGAVEMYNIDNGNSMKTLDVDLLINKGYLKPIYGSEPDCQYLSEGDLTIEGKIYCKQHINPEEEIKKIRMKENRDNITRIIILIVFCSIPSLFYIFYCFVIKIGSPAFIFFISIILSFFFVAILGH